MPTITTCGPFPGFVAGAKFGVSYTNLKTYSDESADVDAFIVLPGATGTLYYNTGSTLSPVYVPFDNASYAYEVRLTGVFQTATLSIKTDYPTLPVYTATKISGTDPKLYWEEGASASSMIHDAFRVRVVDNVNSIFSDGDDTVSSGYVAASITGVPNTLFRGAF